MEMSGRVTTGQIRSTVIRRAFDELLKDLITSHSSRPVTMAASIREGFCIGTVIPPGG